MTAWWHCKNPSWSAVHAARGYKNCDHCMQCYDYYYCYYYYKILLSSSVNADHPTITKPVIPLDHDVVAVKTMTMTLMMVKPFALATKKAMPNTRATMCGWWNDGCSNNITVWTSYLQSASSSTVLCKCRPWALMGILPLNAIMMQIFLQQTKIIKLHPASCYNQQGMYSRNMNNATCTTGRHSVCRPAMLLANPKLLHHHTVGESTALPLLTMCSCHDAVANTAHRYVVATAFNGHCHDAFSIAQPLLPMLHC